MYGKDIVKFSVNGALHTFLSDHLHFEVIMTFEARSEVVFVATFHVCD